jgi:lipopolysaccharide transport system ATP-binding protein
MAGGFHGQIEMKIAWAISRAPNAASYAFRASHSMSDILLRASEISKTYTLWIRPADRLTAPALRWISEHLGWIPGLGNWAGRKAQRIARPFRALHPVSCTIRRGESLGIIGRNGSGKSTLLQILAGTLTPTSGSVERNGRLAALLELGSGFNLDFTGRENVYLQAAVYGIPPAEMESHFQEVTGFAEIGDFIDQPVKTYSSGMLVRLAFAVQVVLKPDLLIVDEALAVGDVFFQARCAAYFRERLAEGMSLIFVSHDLVSMKALCRQAMVLHEGELRFFGDSKEAANVYHALHAKEQRRTTLPSPVAPPAARTWSTQDEIGTREAEFVSCEVTDENDQPRRQFAEGDPIRLRLTVVAHENMPVLHAAFQVVDRHNRALYGRSTIHQELAGLALRSGERATLELRLPGAFGAGEYLVDVALGWGDRGDGAFTHQCHRVGGITSLAISRLTPKPQFLGPVDLQAELVWRTEP